MATIDGSSGNDNLIGTAKDDALYGGGGDDTLNGGAGNDFLYQNIEGTLWGFGGAGADIFHGHNSGDHLDGGPGADTLNGGWGADTLRGGAGDDLLDWFWLSDQEETDRVNGGAGVDRLEVRTSTYTAILDLTAVPNTMIRNVEIIDLLELRHTESRLTLAEADLLAISSTTDTLKVLGDAADTVSIVGPFKDLGVSGAFHRYKIGAGMLLVDTDIPRVYKPTVISGTDDNDTLDGTPADNLLTAHAGDDLLNGGFGFDTLDGGDGNDSLYGGDGDDALDGGDGNDTLYGGAGVDTLNGGNGDDTYIMRATAPTEVNSRNFWDHDVLSDAGGGDKLIFIHQGGALPDGVENLVLRGSGVSTWWSRFAAYGNDLDNLIRSERTGGAAPLIDGGGGDDTLIGSNRTSDYFGFTGPDYGHDFVDGRGGVDWLEVGGVVDFRSGTVTSGDGSGSGSVTFINIEGARGGGSDDLLIANDAGLTLEGRDGDDTLIGGAGDDHLDGEGVKSNGYYFGYDRLIGGAGADTLLGGGYSDYLSGGSGADFLDGGGYYADILLGGGGKDTLIWDPNDTRVDGGGGRDVLRTGGNLDLTKTDNSLIENVEIVDLGGDGYRLTLNEADLLDLSSTADTLKVLGNRADMVDIVGSFEDLGVSGRFHEYKLGAGTLLVHTAITDVG